MSIAKKIAFFTPTLHGGGAERMMIDIANEFVKKGYQVDLNPLVISYFVFVIFYS